MIRVRLVDVGISPGISVVGDLLGVHYDEEDQPWYEILFDGETWPEEWPGENVRVVTDS